MKKKKAEGNFTKFVISKFSDDFGKDDKKHKSNFLANFRFLLHTITANC